MNGKGDSPRNCFSDAYRENYDAIFKKPELKAQLRGMHDGARIARAATTWRHEGDFCECGNRALTGRLDGEIVGVVCHACANYSPLRARV